MKKEKDNVHNIFINNNNNIFNNVYIVIVNIKLFLTVSSITSFVTSHTEPAARRAHSIEDYKEEHQHTNQCCALTGFI